MYRQKPQEGIICERCHKPILGDFELAVYTSEGVRTPYHIFPCMEMKVRREFRERGIPGANLIVRAIKDHLKARF